MTKNTAVARASKDSQRRKIKLKIAKPKVKPVKESKMSVIQRKSGNAQESKAANAQEDNVKPLTSLFPPD